VIQKFDKSIAWDTDICRSTWNVRSGCAVNLDPATLNVVQAYDCAHASREKSPILSPHPVSNISKDSVEA
jgi:hypothetical protein